MTLTEKLVTPPVAGDDRRTVCEDLRVLMIAALAGTAVVHARVVPEHLHHWFLAGAFFVCLAAAEAAVAFALLLRQRRLVVAAALGVSLLPLTVWTVSRTIGLPFGPEAGLPEPVAWADAVSSVLEALTATSAWLLLRARRTLLRCAPASPLWMALGLGAVALLTSLGVVGAGLEHEEHAPAAGVHQSHVEQSGAGHSHDGS